MLSAREARQITDNCDLYKALKDIEAAALNGEESLEMEGDYRLKDDLKVLGYRIDYEYDYPSKITIRW